MVGSCSALGRPRCFDIDHALEQALDVFWRKGYDGTSLNDLTQAMGINKPSLYSAFGNKEQLFLQAIELYEDRHGAFFYQSLEQPTLLESVEYMLEHAVSNLSDPTQPQGCIVVQGALLCSDAASSVKQALIERRKQGGEALKERVRLAKAQGELRDGVSADGLAHYLATILQGLTVHVTNGVSEQELREVAALAIETIKSNLAHE